MQIIFIRAYCPGTPTVTIKGMSSKKFDNQLSVESVRLRTKIVSLVLKI